MAGGEPVLDSVCHANVSPQLHSPGAVGQAVAVAHTAFTQQSTQASTVSSTTLRRARAIGVFTQACGRAWGSSAGKDLQSPMNTYAAGCGLCMQHCSCMVCHAL